MPNAPKRPPRMGETHGRYRHGHVADIETAPENDPNKDPAAVALGRKGGLKGGRARADSLTGEERKKIAQTATGWFSDARSRRGIQTGPLPIIDRL
jgi:hypothetical protein